MIQVFKRVLPEAINVERIEKFQTMLIRRTLQLLALLLSVLSIFLRDGQRTLLLYQLELKELRGGKNLRRSSRQSRFCASLLNEKN